MTEGVLSFRDLPSLTLKARPQIYVFQVQIFIVISLILHLFVCQCLPYPDRAVPLALDATVDSLPQNFGFTLSHLCGVGGAPSSTRTDPVPNNSVFPSQYQCSIFYCRGVGGGVENGPIRYGSSVKTVSPSHNRTGIKRTNKQKFVQCTIPAVFCAPSPLAKLRETTYVRRKLRRRQRSPRRAEQRRFL